MAADPRKRQRKKERQSAKRKEKKHLVIREQSTGLAERLTAATRFPILHATVSDVLWSEGMGTVQVSRAMPNNMVALAVFLVDRYCLGVKDAFARIISRAEYDSVHVRRPRTQFTILDVSPAKARKIVEAAVEYARDLGFPPPEDYHVAKLLFGDIDASQCTEEFEFGKDGKPLFISGPNETMERCSQIRDTLDRSRGPGGFDYIIQVGPGGKIRPEEIGLVTDEQE